MPTLAEQLDRLTAPAALMETQPNGDVRCFACGHRCRIHPGGRGICQVRFNHGGELRMPWGYIAAAQVDPVEKKPFAHLLPGSDALTFGMLGCDFHCAYCQNWFTSQALRSPDSASAGRLVQTASPEALEDYAKRSDCRILVSSYNEPLITTEWAAAVFEQAHARGVLTAIVSNGNATPQALTYLRPHLDAIKIDLKAMSDKTYRSLGGVRQNVLDSICLAHELGLWLEVVTLVVPGLNDSAAELWDAARFLASVSVDIPWHVTAFHPDYKMDHLPPTRADSLQRAAEIGQEAGLRHVYAGNLPGRVGSLENTTCPNCLKAVIERRGYTIQAYRLDPSGCCPYCGTKIAGLWPKDPSQVRQSGPGLARRALF